MCNVLIYNLYIAQNLYNYQQVLFKYYSFDL